MCEKYNGWSNYQTWVFNLWYDDYFSDIAQELYDRHGCTRVTIFNLSEHIKDVADELVPSDASVSSDLFGHAVGMIDCHEIAQAYIDEIMAQEEVAA